MPDVRKEDEYLTNRDFTQLAQRTGYQKKRTEISEKNEQMTSDIGRLIFELRDEYLTSGI
jgi:hypothetical protein